MIFAFSSEILSDIHLGLYSFFFVNFRNILIEGIL
jgi:hypothetical protein